MKKTFLIRTSESDQGTFGHLVMGDHHWHTGELPWRDNLPTVSRIPPGEYLCFSRKNGANGDCYELNDVPERGNIQIHVGNWCGDTEKGWKSDVKGCIVLGQGRFAATPDGYAHPQEGIKTSKAAISDFLKNLNGEALMLLVEDRIT